MPFPKDQDLLPAFENFDLWSAGLPENRRALVENHFKFTAPEDLEEERKHFLSVALISQRTGRDAEEVSRNLETLYIPSFAKDVRGLNMAFPPKDAGEFYQQARIKLIDEKDERETFGEGSMAAFRGDDVIPALQAWQAKNGLERMAKSTAFTKGFLGAREWAGDQLEFASNLLGQIESNTGLTKGEGEQRPKAASRESAAEFEQSLATLADMQPEDRKKVYAIIAAKAEAAGYDPKGFWAQMLSEFGKGMARAGDTVSTSGADLLAGGSMVGGDAAGGFAPVPADSQERFQQGMEARGKRGVIFAEIENLVAGTVDPVKPVLGWMNDTVERGLIKGPGAVAPFMMASAALGPYGAGVLFTADFAEQNRRDLVISGMDEGQARVIGMAAAPLQAVTESLSNALQLGRFPAVQKVLASFTKPIGGGAGLITRYVQNSAISLGTEFTEEQLQDNFIVPAIQNIVAAFDEDVPSVGMGQMWDNIKKSSPELFWTLAPMALVFGGTMTAAQANLSAVAISSQDMLEAAGFSSAQANTIRSETAPEAQIAKARELWGQRAGTAKSIEDAAKSVGERMKLLQTDHMAAQLELERRGILPRMLRSAEDNWRLTFSDGSTADFHTHQDADAARWQWATDQLGKVHVAVQRTLRQMEGNAAVGREFALQFSPEERYATPEEMATKDFQDRVKQGELLDEVRPEQQYSDAVAIDKASGDDVATKILGSSVNTFKDGVLTTTMKLYHGADITTLVEEKLEGDAKAIMADPDGRQWMLEHMRSYENASGDKLFASDNDADITDKMLAEAWSHVGQSYLVGKSTNAKAWPARTARRMFSYVLNAGLSPVMNAETQYWRAVALRAQKLAELQKAGKLGEDLTAELERQLGIDSQLKHENAVADAVAAEMADTSGYSEENPGPNGETFSVREMDTEYMAAVEAGDVAKQQAMVDAAAKAAGYDSPVVYHGTLATFSEFSKDKLGSYTGAQSAKKGFFFASSKDNAEYYTKDVWASILKADPDVVAANAEYESKKSEAEKASEAQYRSQFDPSLSTSERQSFISEMNRAKSAQSAAAGKISTTMERRRKEMSKVLPFYLKVENMAEVDFKNAPWRPETFSSAIDRAQSNGNDGIHIKNTKDPLPTDVFVVFDPNQIKSADPVTRDAEGNVIPLSQRFNPERNEITFSLRKFPVPPGLAEAAQKARGESSLILAYQAAQRGSSSAMVPIRAVYEQAKKHSPALTPAAFMAQINALNEAGSVLIGLSETTKAVDEAGAFRVGAAGTEMAFAPQETFSLAKPSPGGLSEAEARKKGFVIGPLYRGETSGSGNLLNNPLGGVHFSVTEDYARGYATEENDTLHTALINPGQRILDLRNVLNENDLLQRFISAGIDVDRLKYDPYPWSQARDAHEPKSVREIVREVSAERSDFSDFSPNEEITDALTFSRLSANHLDSIVFPEHGNPKNITWIVMRPAQVMLQRGGQYFPINPESSRAAGGTFSLRSGDFASRMAAAFSPFQRNPELRMAIAQVAKQRAQKLGAEWIEKAAALRSASSITGESRVREALAYEARMNEYLDGLTPNARQTLEFEPAALEDDPLIAAMLDHGKLMSRTTARKLGKVEAKSGDYDGAPWLPPAWYSKGAGIMPDQMAQAMHDAGLLPDAYTDTLWEAIASRIASTKKDKTAHREAVTAYKAAQKYARDASKAEAEQWAEKATKAAGSPKAQRESLAAATRTIEGILAAVPPEVRARADGYIGSRMAKLATDEARLKLIEETIAKLNVELEKWLKKEYLQRIAKLFKRFAPKKDDKGRITSNITAEAAEDIGFAFDFASLDDANQEKEMAAIEKTLEESEDAAEIQDAIGKLAIVQLFHKLEKRESSELEAAAMWIDELGSGAREARKIIDAARAEWVKEAKDAAKADASNGKLSSLPDAENVEADVRSSTFKRFTNDVKGFLNSALFTMGQQLEIVFGQDSRITTEFHRRAVRAANDSTDIKRDIEARREAFVADLFGTSSRIKQAGRMGALTVPSASGVVVEAGGKTKTIDVPADVVLRIIEGTADLKALGFTKDEAATLADAWADNNALPVKRQKRVFQIERRGEGKDVELTMSQDEAIQYLLWSNQKASREQMERDGWSKESFQQLNAFLSDDARALAKFFADEYARMGRLIEPVYRRMFNAPFPQVDNYSPIFRDISKADSIIDIDQQGHGSGVSSGFILARNKNARSALRRTSAISAFMQHTQSAAHWITHVELVRDLRSVLIDKEVQNAIRSNGRTAAANGIKKRVMQLENQGKVGAAGIAELDSWGSRLLQARAFKGLAWRISPVMKQASAYFNPLLADVPAWDYMRGTARLLSGQLDVSAMWNSPDIQRRIEMGFSAESRIAMDKLGYTGSTLLAAMGKGMLPMTLTDAGWTTAGAAVAFDYYRRNNVKSGMNEAQAESAALDQLEMMIAESAQPADPANRSLIEGLQNPWLKSMWMFASESRKTLAVEIMALRRLATGKSKNKAMDVQRAVVAHVVMATTTQLMAGILSLLMGDDDDREREWSVEEWASAIVAGPINGLFLFGDAFNYVGRRLFGLHAFEPSTAIGQAVKTVSYAPSNLDKVINGEPEEQRKAFLRLSEALGQAAAIVGPGNPFTAADVILGNPLKDAEKILSRVEE